MMDVRMLRGVLGRGELRWIYVAFYRDADAGHDARRRSGRSAEPRVRIK
jgi:hypothetical protein